MKRVILCAAVCLLVLCGCSSEPSDLNTVGEDSYNKGYQDGYAAAFEESLDTKDYAEEVHSFQTAIAELMYDHEYEVVKKLSEYYPKGVETALEIEFGVKDIAAAIDYLQKLSETVIGNCEFCGNPVYADEFALLPDGIECAHGKCVSDNSIENSYQINKED